MGYKRKKRFGVHCLAARLLAFVMVLVLVCPGGGYTLASGTSYKIPAYAKTDGVNVRTNAGTSSAKVVVDGKNVTLYKKQPVSIIGSRKTAGVRWYKISFTYNKKTVKGYASSDYISLTLKNSVKGKMYSASKVYQSPSKKSVLKDGKKTVSLKKAQAVTITGETTVSNMKYFKVKFVQNKKNYSGYVKASLVSFAVSSSQSSTATSTKTGTVTASALNVRSGAGTNYAVVTSGGTKVVLLKGTKVTILSTKTVDKTKWYKIKVTYNGKTVTGYVSADYVSTGETSGQGSGSGGSSGSGSGNSGTGGSSGGSGTDSSGGSGSSGGENSGTVSDAEFKKDLVAQGFPSDYIASLMTLHQKYPKWKFTAHVTGLDWNTVVSNQAMTETNGNVAKGRNLISKNKSLAWISTLPGSLDWTTDKFITYDGGGWVNASKGAVEYYMDPRNFLTEDTIFQFLVQTYNSKYQKTAGVQKILSQSKLEGSYTYEENGKSVTKTYADTFMDAAKTSGVNPYILASRVKQEVVTANGLSSIVSGKVSGYEGYYNYYNIQATGGNAISNGLRFAKNGTYANGIQQLSAAKKAEYLIPWNNRYKAIVGGAVWIGGNYIAVGQDTNYLQKFNVATCNYGHQYMQNVEAAKAESKKIYTAYSGITSEAIEFKIPVYKNMPSSPCKQPSGGTCPNNWLKTLTVTDNNGKKLTTVPAFAVRDAEGTRYTLEVGADVTSVVIAATSVCSDAAVTGTGEKTLSSGTKSYTVSCKSQSGNTRKYVISIIKKAE